MSVRGRISKWNDERGFGFITPDSGGNEVFVHVKAFPRNGTRPHLGAAVTYDLAHDAQGRRRAHNVRLMDTSLSPGPAEAAFLAGIVFLSFVGAVAAHDRLPFAVFWWYLGMSALTLGLYAIDKSAAKNNDDRIPENTLHLLSLLGGWPGALYGQQLLRHKSRKMPFRVVFWMTVVINMVALVLLLSPYGAPYRALLDALKH